MQLATDRLILRELVEDDWRPLHALESQPEIVRYLPHDVRSEDDARGYVTAIRLEALELPRMVIELAITLRGDDTMIGRCGVRRRSSDPRLASCWYVISPAHGRQGYATEAARALLAYGFGELRLHRVHGECDPRNSSSARVMERLGMRREAEHVEDVWIKGEWCGTLVYAMLDRDWAARS